MKNRRKKKKGWFQILQFLREIIIQQMLDSNFYYIRTWMLCKDEVQSKTKSMSST
jgi:hypothetical protein